MTNEQIAALRKASAVLCGTGYHDEASAINGLLAASAEPVAEVGPRIHDGMANPIRWVDMKAMDSLPIGTKLYTRPAQDDVRDAQRWRMIKSQWNWIDTEMIDAAIESQSAKEPTVGT